MFEFVPQLIVIIALVVIIVIVAKKVPKTVGIKEEDIKKESKNEIWVKVSKGAGLIWGGIRKFGLRFLGKLSSKAKKVRERAGISGKKEDEEELSRLVRAEPVTDKTIPQASAEEIVDLIEKASNYLGRGNFDEAEKVYIKIISKDPRNARAYRGLGKIYKRQRNFKDAEASFKQVLKLEPDDKEAKKELKELDEMS
jgi:tetratricopeptide (TPR) repeat protein